VSFFSSLISLKEDGSLHARTRQGEAPWLKTYTAETGPCLRRTRHPDGRLLHIRVGDFPIAVDGGRPDFLRNAAAGDCFGSKTTGLGRRSDVKRDLRCTQCFKEKTRLIAVPRLGASIQFFKCAYRILDARSAFDRLRVANEGLKFKHAGTVM